MTLDSTADGRAEPEDRFVPPWHIGVDVGGTFTDVVLIDSRGALSCFKSLSRPDNPATGIVDALKLSGRALDLTIDELLAGCTLFVHGTTVATNTLIEGKGAKVGLLTTRGFRDALEIRRGFRRHPWDHRTPYPPVLVPRYLRLPVDERIDKHGRQFEPMEPDSVASALTAFAAEGVESIAICFLNSYLNDDHEQKAAAIARRLAPGSWVSVSSDVAPIAGEYARVSTTVVDAYVAPRLIAYLGELKERLTGLGLAAPLLLVKNNGGTATIEEVSTSPVQITLSGPAAAVGGLGHVAGHIGGNDLISMEIGGTSCDVVMMKDGEVAVTDSLGISDYDLAIASAEVHTVGAGGGTIAGVDKAGLLFVGPRGAGARPGPACYGLGGAEPTVTDAQMVLGRLGPGEYAGGALTLDAARAEQAIQRDIAEPLGLSLGEAAAGIVRVMEQNVLHAVSYISVQRGLDPRRFVLVAGGGAGGLHGAIVGRLLGSPKVYVPRLGGVFCALGMLNSDVRHDVVHSFVQSVADADPATIDAHMNELLGQVRAVLDREGFRDDDACFEREIDLRYQGQQWDVRVRLPGAGQWDWSSVRADFEREYDRLFGHVQPQSPLEIVKLRVTGSGKLSIPRGATAGRRAETRPEPYESRRVYLDPEAGEREIPIYRGHAMLPGHVIDGPLIVEEATTTILVGRHDRLSVDDAGNYMVELPRENS